MKVSGGGVYSAGAGLALTAGSFSLTPAPVRLTVDLPSTNATGVDTGLDIPLLANTNYIVWGRCYVVGGGATSMNLLFHALAAGAAAVGGVFSQKYSATDVLGGQGAEPIAIGTDFTGGSSATFYVNFEVLITVGVNPTTARIDYTDTGVTNTLKAGSWIQARVVT